MFMVEQRQRVRMALLERAREDERIVGAAITGSAARDAEDRWSDVDLFFGVADSIAVEETLGDWSAFMYRELGAIHHLDLHAGPAIYRAFLRPLRHHSAGDAGARADPEEPAADGVRDQGSRSGCSTSARTLAGLPDPPTIGNGDAIRTAPDGGSSRRFRSWVRPYLFAPWKYQ
jgi:hypothetical protein